jgi:hypothetical protein
MRRQFGDWQSIPRELLEDLYGLTSGTISFGMGLSKEKAFLILRERQNEQNRGGYAYSLLLDPGEDTWRAFGWNAAALAHTIMTRPELHAALVEWPERPTREVLCGMLADLRPDPPPPAAAFCANPRLAATWIGCTLQASSATVNPADLDLQGRPTPAQVAAFLTTLPPCFRGGRGWLMNGSRVHGQHLGAHLVADPLLPLGGGQAASASEGDNVLSRWRRVERECGQALRGPGATPVWQWATDGETLRDAIYRVLHLAESRTASARQVVAGYSAARIASAAVPTRSHWPPLPRASNTTM